MPNHLKLLPLFLLFLFSNAIAGNKNPICETCLIAKPLIKINLATDIVEFNAISDGQRVYINWASGNEKKYDYFTIEKAKDGVHFESAFMIKSGGTTERQVDYIDVDYSPYTGISYYRLKQTDYIGQVSYSAVVAVNYQFAQDGTIISCRDLALINLNEMGNKEILVLVKDLKGEETISKIMLTEITMDGVYATDLQGNLIKGTYLILASSYNRLFSQNLIIR